MNKPIVFAVLPMLLVAGCARQDTLPTPPVAEQRHFQVVAPHGASRVDEYYWLRDDERADPQMLAYLNAENAYADAVLAPVAELKTTLYEELVGRIKQDDATVPYRDGDFWYITRFEEGREYPLYTRRQGGPDGPEQILLDVNALAEGYGFYQVATREISPDQQQLAYLVDDVGRRQFKLFVKDLATGETHDTGVSGLSLGLAWSGDGSTLFYVSRDPVTLLTTRVLAHTLGTDAADDRLVYAESDDSFYIGIGTTQSRAYICIVLSSTVSGEQRCARRDDPREFRVIAARERDIEYEANHLGDRWVMRTNRDAQNFKLMQLRDGNWIDLVPHDGAVYISGFELFDNFIAIAERSGGLTRVRVRPEHGEAFFVEADESAYAMSLSVNAMPDTDLLRYTYTSLTTPVSTYELDVKTGERVLLKEEPVLGGFDKDDYETHRLWAPAADGTRIPVTVVHRKGLAIDGTAALLQYGYGSYGISMDPRFNPNIISLLDRGMVYAIAHVRGGQEMGRAWYEDGKLMNKMNSFTDFIAVTDFLVAESYAAPDRVAALGGSAGGLLMGAVTNLAPEKYSVILSLVPFVDVVTGMLDHTIPLTTTEFDEWGNPEDPAYYAYMLAYSPYDNIEAKAYPTMFVGTGLWDSQVQYWDPAKYVARLRALKTDDNLVVFRTQMEAGHGGRSGRFQRFYEIAEYYAFMLDQLGVR